MSDDLVKEARELATLLEHRDNIRNGSQGASELRQSPEWRSSAKLREAADRIGELEREKLEAVAAAYEDAATRINEVSHMAAASGNFTQASALANEAENIRAITPADAQAALAARDDRVREDALWEALGIAGRAVKDAHTDEAQTYCNAVYDAILALVRQDDSMIEGDTDG